MANLMGEMRSFILFADKNFVERDYEARLAPSLSKFSVENYACPEDIALGSNFTNKSYLQCYPLHEAS
jgi:hypothetical protein